MSQVVFASTGGAIYGEQDVYPADEDHPSGRSHPMAWPSSPASAICTSTTAQYGLDATCLRYANVYGPRQSPHGEAGVVAIFMHKLLADEQPIINGDGRQTRDYVFVDDVVRANLAVLGQTGFRTYNVGTGIETDVNELFEPAPNRHRQRSTRRPRPGQGRRAAAIVDHLGAHRRRARTEDRHLV